jgi:hypothetical protein
MVLPKLFKVIGAFGVLASIHSAKAECNPRDFLVKDTQALQESSETELAFVLTATKDEFDEAKRDIGIGGRYGIISGSATFPEAKDKATKIAQSTKFDYHSSYAKQYFVQTISPNALKA